MPALPTPIDAEIAMLAKRDTHAFEILTAAYRRELERHCYRMMGSLQDAEDLVQETFMRAWEHLETFRQPFSFRAWLYKIATNACLDALAKRPRRSLPIFVYPPADPSEPFTAPPDESPFAWLEPFPEELIAGQDTDPEARYSAVESLSLAFLTVLQALSPRQRAVLILCEVLDWKAKEAAQLLDLSVAALNSALHRARSKMHRMYPFATAQLNSASPNDAATQMLLERYIRAWENADISTLLSILQDEARVSMPPSPSWYQGSVAIGEFMRRTFFSGAARGRWKLLPTRANGQPAAGVYQRAEPSGSYHPFSLHLLSFAQGRCVQVISFIEPELFGRFGLPSQLAPTTHAG